MSEPLPDLNHIITEQPPEKKPSKEIEMCQIIYYDFSLK